WGRRNGGTMHAAPAAGSSAAQVATTASPKFFSSRNVETGEAAETARVSAAFHLSLDPDYHTVSIRMSYVGAAVAATTLIAAIGISFALGRHGTRGAMPALAEQTTEQLRQMPARADVMDI